MEIIYYSSQCIYCWIVAQILDAWFLKVYELVQFLYKFILLITKCHEKLPFTFKDIIFFIKCLIFQKEIFYFFLQTNEKEEPHLVCLFFKFFIFNL